MKGDLHCHTKLSDGSLGIEDIIVQAKRTGIDFISITDHDTMSSISRAKILGERYGVQILPGVELSAWDKTRGSITVTNHSNVDVQVTVAYLPEPDTGIKGVLKNASARLKAGVVGDYKGADHMTATLTVSGKPEKTVNEAGMNVGKLRITIE